MTQKVAFVTGAGQGIGAAIADRLSRDGFAVALIGRTKTKLDDVAATITNHGGKAIALVADVADRDQVFKAVDDTIAQLGDLNVIVNNAGVAPTTPIDDVTPEQLAEVTMINTGGVVWGTQAAHAAMKRLGHGGKIINATSQAGEVGNPNLTVYGSTKFAIRGITQTTAKELAADQITVNAYAPGIVRTPMMMDIAHEVGQNAGKDDEWGLQTFTKDITLNRLSEAEDVANVVSFLAGTDSDYITGQTITVDGGMVFH